MYVERQVAGKTRKGLLLCLDLEQYDYNKGSQSLIRATEGTIVDRLRRASASAKRRLSSCLTSWS